MPKFLIRAGYTAEGIRGLIKDKPSGRMAAVKKAVALGKEIRKQPEKTKADAAREMYTLIAGEPRDIIIQAFVDGAGLTPKGAQTYFYNCRRKAKKTE